jgi:hypothetical protein
MITLIFGTVFNLANLVLNHDFSKIYKITLIFGTVFNLANLINLVKIKVQDMLQDNHGSE